MENDDDLNSGKTSKRLRWSKHFSGESIFKAGIDSNPLLYFLENFPEIPASDIQRIPNRTSSLVVGHDWAFAERDIRMDLEVTR